MDKQLLLPSVLAKRCGQLLTMFSPTSSLFPCSRILPLYHCIFFAFRRDKASQRFLGQARLPFFFFQFNGFPLLLACPLPISRNNLSAFALWYDGSLLLTCLLLITH